jgi:thiosulfate/3-mercaptopyruvate sulfurtransferase
VLTVFGHPRVALLDGGIEKWIAEAHPLENIARPTAAATFRPGHGVCAAPITAQEIVARLDDPGLRIVDVRAPEEFSGDQLRAARGGHVPGAVLLPWDGNLRDDRTVCSPAEIRARVEAAGVFPEQEVVTYCQGGVRAAHTALALTLAGYPRVRVYDGSWAERGNDPVLPSRHPWRQPDRRVRASPSSTPEPQPLAELTVPGSVRGRSWVS